MKRLFIITAILALTVSSVGCRSCRWLWRGAPENEQPVMLNPCCPPQCAAPCDTCTPGACTQPGPGNVITGMQN
ncbi:MAG: hypothetical protein PVH19_14295 [Planctomycetia bacterium]